MGTPHPGTFLHQGHDRNYILYEPDGYVSTTPLPLVFMLPGRGGTIHEWCPLPPSQGPQPDPIGILAKADQEHFFVAFLEGQPCIQHLTDAGPCRNPHEPVLPQTADWDCHGELVFNAGLTPVEQNVDDVDYVRSLLAYLETQWAIDSERVFAAGLSNGGAMCHRLGAELSDKLAAIAVVGGAIALRQSDCTFAVIPNAKGPISVLIIHGQADSHVQYYGGQGSGPGQLYAKSVREAVDFWVAADHCQPLGTTTATQFSPDGTVIVTTENHPGGSGGTEVSLITLVNGEHEWSHPTQKLPNKFSDTDAVWDFFSQHSLAAPSTTPIPIDPIALALALPVPLVFTLPDPPPPFELEQQIRQVVQTMTPQQKQSALAQVNVFNTYVNAAAQVLTQG
jgi:poly(3-hydroxybutyrate) depolymerase